MSTQQELPDVSDMSSMSDEEVEEHILSLCLSGRTIAATGQYRRYKHSRGEDHFTLKDAKAAVDALMT